MTEVDMMAEAREAQWSAEAFLGSDAIKLVAPAKVNLFLGIGARRDDGYHDVTTVMHALALHDSIYMNVRAANEGDDGASVNAGDGKAGVGAGSGKAVAASDGGAVAMAGPAESIAVSINMVDKAGTGGVDVSVKDNLVFQAIDALAHETGRTSPEWIDVRVEKCIPAQAGLGGGSSDAAAALIGAAHFWGLRADDDALFRVAASLGADVAFFLRGGCALLTGVGEQLKRALTPMKFPVLLVKPAGGVSTGAAYRAFDRDARPVPADVLAVVEKASTACEVPLFNNLASAAEACMPGLGDIVDWMAGQPGVVASGDDACGRGDARVLLSGSGSAVFAVCESTDAALRLAAEVGKRGLWTRATAFSSLRAAKVG